MLISEAVKIAIEKDGLIARPSEDGVIMAANRPCVANFPLTGYRLNGEKIAPNWQPSVNDLMADDWLVITGVKTKTEQRGE